MSPDCKSPQCHEAMQLELKERVTWKDFNLLKDCTRKKVSRKTAWSIVCLLFPLIIILSGVAIKGWSRQEAAHLKFAEKEELTEYQRETTKVKTAVGHLVEDMRELKKGQNEVQRDIKEILKRLPK